MSGICNEQGDFENIIFSYANNADCKIAEKLAEVVKGTIFADAWYLQKKDDLNKWKKMELNLKLLQIFRHFLYSIAVYMINRNLDFYQNFFRLRLI